MHLPCAGGGPSCNTTTPPPALRQGQPRAGHPRGSGGGEEGGGPVWGRAESPVSRCQGHGGGRGGACRGGSREAALPGGTAGERGPRQRPRLIWHTCTLARVCAHLWTSSAGVPVRVGICPHVYTHPHSCTHVHTRAHAYSLMQTHVRARSHAHVHMFTHAHTYLRAHSCPRLLTQAHTGTTRSPPPPTCTPPPAAVWVWVPPPSAPPCPPRSVPSAGVTCPHTALLCREYTGDTQHGVGGGQTDRRTGHKPAVPRPTGTPPPQSLAPAASLRAGDQPRTPALGGTGSPLQTPPAPSCEALPQTPVGMLWGSGGGWRWGPPILVPWLAAGWVTVPGGQGGPAAPGVLANRGHP